MQKYFFQVVQDDVISEKIYCKIKDYFDCDMSYEYGIRYSEAHYGKLAIKITNYGLEQAHKDEFENCKPELKDTIYKLSEVFTSVPQHSHFDMAAKIYLNVCCWKRNKFGVVRMRDPEFFIKFDEFLRKNRWKRDEEHMKVINVLVQDGTYRLDHNRYDYVISPTGVGEQFAEIIKEVTGI